MRFQWDFIKSVILLLPQDTGSKIDTGSKMNVHKTFRRRPGCLLNVLCMFSLRRLSTGTSLQFYSLVIIWKSNLNTIKSTS